MDYPPRMAGGTTVHTYQLAKALRCLGNEVHAVAASADAPKEEVREGINIHRVRRPYTLFSALRTRALLEGIDVVHAHSTCAFGHLILNKFPTVVKMHNTWRAEFQRYLMIKGNLRKRIDTQIMMRAYVFMDRYCVRKAEHVICISNVVRRETLKYGIDDKKITVIHNGIDLEMFMAKNDLREQLGLDGIVVGYIGRLEPHKNVELLIRVFKEIDAKLLIIGEGSDRRRLESIVERLGVSDKVIFKGKVNFDEIPKYYNSVDIIVYPTLYEPLGNVILEAMASGKPVIASKLNGIPEILSEKAGFLIEPEYEALKEKLSMLIEDDALRKSMGNEGRRCVKRFSWTEVARRTVEVCESILRH